MPILIFYDFYDFHANCVPCMNVNVDECGQIFTVDAITQSHI